jgi:hypothetical protein
MATTASPLTLHLAWTRAVQATAQKARTAFPSLEDRIEKAALLVLLGYVEQPDSEQPNFYTVRSQKDPHGTKPYAVHCGTPPTCDCEDFTYRKSEECPTQCKHILAAWIYRRALSAPEIALPTAAPSCPEALFSLSLNGPMDGHHAILTVRGQTWEEFSANVARVRGLLDAPAPPTNGNGHATPTPEPSAPAWVCPYHGKALPSKKVAGQLFCPSKMADGSRCTQTSDK